MRYQRARWPACGAALVTAVLLAACAGRTGDEGGVTERSNAAMFSESEAYERFMVYLPSRAPN